MLLTHLLGLVLLATQQVVSLPTESEFKLVARDDCGAGGDLAKRAACTQPVQCGTDKDAEGAQTYSVDDIKKAVNWAKRSFPDKEGQFNGYPKYYGVSDNGVKNALPADCKGSDVTKYEFPILPTGLYQGGDPKTDRVVLGEKKLPSGTFSRFFCLVMTHRGLGENAFKVCPPSTG